MSKDIKRVEAPNLIEFVNEIQDYVQQGYTVTDTNAGIPQSWGPGLYTCELEKASEAPQKPLSKMATLDEGSEENATESASEASKDESESKPKRSTRRRTKK